MAPRTIMLHDCLIKYLNMFSFNNNNNNKRKRRKKVVYQNTLTSITGSRSDPCLSSRSGYSDGQENVLVVQYNISLSIQNSVCINPRNNNHSLDHTGCDDETIQMLSIPKSKSTDMQTTPTFVWEKAYQIYTIFCMKTFSTFIFHIVQ